MIEYRHGNTGLDYHAYRKGVFDCPFCDFVQERGKAGRWFSKKQVRAIIFIDDGFLYKKGHALVVSECPKCFKNSFHHWLLTMMLHNEWADRKKIQVEIARLEQITLEEWNTSLCKRCSVPKEVRKNKFGYYVVCDGRMGPPSKPDEEPPFLCTSFKEAER